ncbi:DUF2255 family protein [Streptomyces sp. NBC_00104]|uniref:DUF2255 family protein n=1 Tax=unclassified Streptomyces TaxID=2593676 RepID=UPI0032506E0E
MTSTAPWTDDELDRVGAAEELEVASRSRDGLLSGWRTIWVVRVDNGIYVRSVNGPTSAWFRGTRACHEGRVQAGGVERDVAGERLLAETTATEEALKALPTLAEELDTDPAVAERMRQEYETHLLVVRAGGDTAASDETDALRHHRHYTALRLALLAHKRSTVLRLRDDHEIDDTVLRHVQRHLDLEEVRLPRRQAAE